MHLNDSNANSFLTLAQLWHSKWAQIWQVDTCTFRGYVWSWREAKTGKEQVLRFSGGRSWQHPTKPNTGGGSQIQMAHLRSRGVEFVSEGGSIAVDCIGSGVRCVLMKFRMSICPEKSYTSRAHFAVATS